MAAPKPNEDANTDAPQPTETLTAPASVKSDLETVTTPAAAEKQFRKTGIVPAGFTFDVRARPRLFKTKDAKG